MRIHFIFISIFAIIEVSVSLYTGAWHHFMFGIGLVILLYAWKGKKGLNLARNFNVKLTQSPSKQEYTKIS